MQSQLFAPPQTLADLKRTYHTARDADCGQQQIQLDTLKNIDVADKFGTPCERYQSAVPGKLRLGCICKKPALNLFSIGLYSRNPFPADKRGDAPTKIPMDTEMKLAGDGFGNIDGYAVGSQRVRVFLHAFAVKSECSTRTHARTARTCAQPV